MRTSRTGIVVSAAPGLLLLGLFYSLALHMHRSLGGWPTSIGELGFPPLLVTHATVTEYCFMASIASTFLLVPIAIVTCLLVPRWKHRVAYFAVCGFLFFVSWFLMGLAPGPFLTWWWD
jgi:hypothetical protein